MDGRCDARCALPGLREAQDLYRLHEAAITGGVEHPVIVPVRGLGTDHVGTLWPGLENDDGRSPVSGRAP
jgi:hypothetical protein